MGSPTGFLQYPREDAEHRPIAERIRDWHEIDRPLVSRALAQQAARCIDCAIPYCHGIGCPVKNRIPEFNDLAFRGRWREASDNLHSTNNFPEFTGRICPAPCEAACTLAVNDEPVNIRQIELQIVERAFAEGWIVPFPAEVQTGQKVAIVGSGPAGLAAAQQLARQGHEVIVFEKADRPGGLLRFGIPDFKLEKNVLDRRLEQMTAEGVRFECGANVGQSPSGKDLRSRFDAVVLCMGAGQARELRVPGAELDGVRLAVDYLSRQNRQVAEDAPDDLSPDWNAKDKHAVVIGGGDTGSDCVGTAIRQGARSVTQLEILPKPPRDCNPETPWPMWPKIMRTSTSQEEGCQRRWSTSTLEVLGTAGRVTGLRACEIEWANGPKGWQMRAIPGTEAILPADLVLIAMGFLHVAHEGVVSELGLQLDGRGNLLARQSMTNLPGVFAAGDAVQGASLIVHAINQGRRSAAACHHWLKEHR